MSLRIAYLNGRTYRGVPIPRDETPAQEQPDHALLVAAGERAGVRFELAYWDEPDLPARGYDAALIRSCWDYPQRTDDFIAALERHEQAGLRIFNPAHVVRWNARKTYLRALGAAAIDTIWAEHADARTVAQAFDALDAAEIVLKPQVGAGSVDTIRLRRNAWSEADLIAGPRGAAMIQPYLRAIETEGERSLFWFGGRFSHAIHKLPRAGDWRANIAGARFVADDPPVSAREAAEAARAAAPPDMLYARVDLVLADDGRWRVIEIEAIEPYLFLAFAPPAADALVAAIAGVLNR